VVDDLFLSDVNSGPVCFPGSKGSSYGTETQLLVFRFIVHPCHVQISCFGRLNEEQQISTTTASVDVENWKKPGISNAQSIDLGANTTSTSNQHDSTLSSEDDPTGLPLACERARSFPEKVSVITFSTKTGHVQMKRSHGLFSLIEYNNRVLSLHNRRTYRTILMNLSF